MELVRDRETVAAPEQRADAELCRLTVVAPRWFVSALFAAPAAWWLLKGRHSARLADEMD